MEQQKRLFSKKFSWLAATLLTACFILISAQSYASLTITPLRVTFADRQRTSEIVLINTSNTTNTYRVGWMYNRQKTDGYYEEIESPLNPNFNPADMILFSPRQVTIPPGGRQRIRMSLRRPPEMPDGEYRAHLRFQKLAPDTSPSQDSNQPPGLNLSLMVNLGFSIPVVVRQGPYNAGVTISDVRFIPAYQDEKRQPKLELQLNRTGYNSTTGRIQVYWTPPQGNEVRIGQMNNVTIYPEINKRFVRVTLKTQEIRGGSIRIVYEGDGPEQGIIFDEISMPIGY